MINCCYYCVYANNQEKLKTGSLFDDNEGALKEKNCVSRKIAILSCKYWTLVQLSSKFCVHLEAELVSAYRFYLSTL